MKHWKIQSSEIVLRTPGVDVRRDCVELPNGNIVDDYYVFELCEWATIIPITEKGELVIVEQYRHGIQQVTFEFPAGLIDEQPKSPLMTAQRELAEETGYSSEDWTPLGQYHLGPSKIQNAFHLFLAHSCRRTCDQNLDDTEEIRVHTFTPAEFGQLFDEGKVTDVDSVIGWLLCQEKGLIDLE